MEEVVALEEAGCEAVVAALLEEPSQQFFRNFRSLGFRRVFHRVLRETTQSVITHNTVIRDIIFSQLIRGMLFATLL